MNRRLVYFLAAIALAAALLAGIAILTAERDIIPTALRFESAGIPKSVDI